MHPSVVEMWRAFLAWGGGADTELSAVPLSAWHFCDNQVDADACAVLACTGRKRATAPALWELHARGEPMPRVGAYHVVTNWDGVATCIIQTTAVEVVPFHAVTATHAA